ncbi:hypothetical protein H0E87_028318 [Populus deltoides]|uniref:Uncharacterized protein n=1 Tax=Populus deltoides TaxID=3696 RepID=A0A8T2WVR6_POPDE|nr:hypothetical protein H0E87_028318 [Populus deltoides]
MSLPTFHQRVSLRLWLVKGVFFTTWALRYLPLMCQDTVSLHQFRVLPRIPQLQLLWNLSKLLVMMPLLVGLWWSLRENPRSTSATPPKGRKCLQLQLCTMSQRSDVPSDCAGVVNSLGTGTVVDAGVDLGATPSMAPPILEDDFLATTPSNIPPLGELVNHNRKLLI